MMIGMMVAKVVMSRFKVTTCLKKKKVVKTDLANISKETIFKMRVVNQKMIPFMIMMTTKITIINLNKTITNRCS